MFKILADECVHTDLIFALKQAGYDVLSVKNAGLAGSEDETVFEFALKNKRILLTFDRGFGDIFRFNIKKISCVVIVLIGQMSREEIINTTLAFFSFVKESEITGRLAIIGKNRIRIIKR